MVYHHRHRLPTLVQCSDGTSAGDIIECGIDDVAICD